MSQTHLNRANTINLGSYYTPRFIVDIAYEMLEKVADLRDFTLLDSSCGYGDFFTKDLRYAGADIDEEALAKVPANVRAICVNSLSGVSRAKFEIGENEPLIIIGNPPYNDKTSIIRSDIKRELFEVDKDLAHRDLGVSFLRSYAALAADFVCVLHPLSYLIKRANFTALAAFRANYRLKDALVISSEIFTPSSSTFFPIVIALYEKNTLGMTYDLIANYEFVTYEGHKFRLKDFDFITNYVHKYPNLNDARPQVAYFHTLRDINALKRNQTFMNQPSSASVKVFAENLKYYCYIHHFKRFAARLPYYFGNMDVFIDNEEFLKISDDFLDLNPRPRVENYFDRLYKEYV